MIGVEGNLFSIVILFLLVHGPQTTTAK